MRKMPLDNVWVIPEGKSHPKLRKDLYGAVYSGPDEYIMKSFRGHLYSEFVEKVTGFSLYTRVLYSADLTLMCQRLVSFKGEVAALGPGYRLIALIKNKFLGHNVNETNLEISLENLDYLIHMFKAYTEVEGVELKSWY